MDRVHRVLRSGPAHLFLLLSSSLASLSSGGREGKGRERQYCTVYRESRKEYSSSRQGCCWWRLHAAAAVPRLCLRFKAVTFPPSLLLSLQLRRRNQAPNPRQGGVGGALLLLRSGGVRLIRSIGCSPVRASSPAIDERRRGRRLGCSKAVVSSVCCVSAPGAWRSVSAAFASSAGIFAS